MTYKRLKEFNGNNIFFTDCWFYSSILPSAPLFQNDQEQIKRSKNCENITIVIQTK
jgi:hypothetical protein